MKVLLALLIGLVSACSFAQPASTNAANVRFEAVDIFVDAQSESLAAYQLEFTVTNAVAKIVGIEGGESPAFREAPFHDPKAMQHERVVIAAFSTAKPLPSRNTRVATIHLQVSGQGTPKIELQLEAAANARGQKISVKTSFEMRAKK